MKLAALHSLLAAAIAAASVSSAAATDLEQAMGKSSNWATQAGDYANHRYSDLKQINAGNVGSCRWHGRCRPACCAATRARRS